MSASHVEDSVVASVGWRDIGRARRAVRGALEHMPKETAKDLKTHQLL